MTTSHEVRDGQRGGGLALAALSGARTFLGPTLAARRAGARRGFRRLTTLLAAFELIVFDQLPGVAARTAPPQLLGRALSGGAVAVKLRRPGRGAATAALSGAAVAVASAFLTLRLRYALIRAFGRKRLGSALCGVVEDVALLAIGRRLAR